MSRIGLGASRESGPSAAFDDIYIKDALGPDPSHLGSQWAPRSPCGDSCNLGGRRDPGSGQHLAVFGEGSHPFLGGLGGQFSRSGPGHDVGAKVFVHVQQFIDPVTAAVPGVATFSASAGFVWGFGMARWLAARGTEPAYQPLGEDRFQTGGQGGWRACARTCKFSTQCNGHVDVGC